MPAIVTLTAAFGLICLASYRVGRWFTAVKLPYITGYLAVGALVGTFGLGLIPSSSSDQLRFLDELSLGVIAFVAGSELRVADLRGRLRAIGAITGGIVVVGLGALGATIFVVTGVLAFAADMAVADRVATAALGAAVLLALSPPSTIAVIRDLRARGPFTSQVLITTVVMDVVIVVLFAVAGSLAAALLRGTGFDAGFAVALVVDLAAAVGGGLLVGHTFGALLTRTLPLGVRIAAVIGTGYAIFVAASAISSWTAANLPVEIYIEPLLLCLVAGFVVRNRTAAGDAFEGVLHDVSPAVYVVFFTLTGLSLRLDVLLALLPAAAALFGVRLAALFVGTRFGASLAGAAPSFRRRSWMAFVTQAGIALGLAREAAVQFPELGESFATLIISVVVLNEIFGPLFLASALRRAGEAAGGPAQRRLVLLFGIGRGTYALADRLTTAGWVVRLADTDSARVNAATVMGRDATRVDLDRLDRVEGDEPAFADPVDALVAMGDDDIANLAVCRVATEHMGVDRVIARVTTDDLVDAFVDAGALVVDPMSAMLGILEEAVVSPQAADLVLHADPGHDTVQITVADARVVGREIRALQLPADVLIVAIDRDGRRITPDGLTRLRRGDDLTLIGTPDGLAETTVRIGY